MIKKESTDFSKSEIVQIKQVIVGTRGSMNGLVLYFVLLKVEIKLLSFQISRILRLRGKQ